MGSKKEIKIKEIILNIEENIHIVYFLDNENPEESFMLQFQDKLTDDEIALGWTKYYLGYADGAKGNYNCIKSVYLNKKRVEFVLNEIGLTTFGIDVIMFKILEGMPDSVFLLLKERFSSEDNLSLKDD